MPSDPGAEATHSVRKKSYGQYYDGLSAKSRPVVWASLGQDKISFKAAEGRILDWRFSEIDWSFARQSAAPYRLKKKGEQDEQLVLTDDNLARQIKDASVRWAKANPLQTETSHIISLTLATAACLAMLWFTWPAIADGLAPYVPDSFRNELGQAAESSYAGKDDICHSEYGDKAIAVLQNRLATGEPSVKDIKIMVVRSDVVNAYSLPGRRVIINEGLITKAQSGDEVAGIMAHEFGHVIHDHVMRAMLRQLPTSLTFASLGANVNGMANAADVFVQLAQSRQYEAEADKTGLELLHGANISPQGFGDFFRREKGSRLLPDSFKYFTTHPPSSERLAMIEAAPEPDDAHPALTALQWHDLQTICGEKKPAKDKEEK